MCHSIKKRLEIIVATFTNSKKDFIKNLTILKRHGSNLFCICSNQNNWFWRRLKLQCWCLHLRFFGAGEGGTRRLHRRAQDVQDSILSTEKRTSGRTRRFPPNGWFRRRQPEIWKPLALLLSTDVHTVVIKHWRSRNN